MATRNRLSAAIRSLDGLSVGDAFGECFFSIATNRSTHEMYLSTQTLPNWRWTWTDDTAMAISVLETLIHRGTIDQDDLADAFAARYAKEDRRGYGGTAHGILMAIGAGEHWREVSPTVMGGMGSMGNGGAMRVAPLGAFFADDVAVLIEEARKSAEVTHAHSEGQAGAIAVALAAAFVALASENATKFSRSDFFSFVLDNMPDSQTRAGIAQAMDLPSEYSVDTAVSALGNGSKLTAPDTVPFCIWSAAKSHSNFARAMWTTVEGGGDMDTNCAIVGGIIAAGDDRPPADWVARRETLPPLPV